MKAAGRFTLLLLLGLTAIPEAPAAQENRQPQTFEIGVGQTGGFGGLNLNTASTQLPPNEAQTADNLWYLRDGAIAMRPGFSRINSTVLGVNAPWAIARFYRPGIQPAFIIGHGPYLWKVSNNGGVASPDSIIGYKDGTAYYTTGSNKVTGKNTKWMNRIQEGDSLIRGATRYEILRVLMDSVFFISANSGDTRSDTAYRIIFNYGGSQFGSIIQVNEEIIGGSERRGAIVMGLTEKPTLLGRVFQGKVNRTKQSGVDCRLIVDLTANLTANEFAGYFLFAHGLAENEDAGGTRAEGQLYKITSHTDTVFTLDCRTNQIPGLGCPVSTWNKINYDIYAPFFTMVDTGTVRRAASTGAPFYRIGDLQHSVHDTIRFDLCAFEFITGRLAGQLFDIGAAIPIPGPPDSTEIQLESFATKITDFAQAGDKYIIWQVGAAARHWTWYNQQLVAANSRGFPNQIRFSEAGTIHNFKPLNFRVISEKTGTQITQLKDFNGDLAIWQEADTWKIPGTNLSTGQLIHSLAGVGCPTPRSLVLSGDNATWMTLVGGEPKVVSWTGGGLKFNVVGQPSVYGGGGLAELSAKIKPRLLRASVDSIGKAAAGLWQDHYILSYPIDGKDTAASAVGYHIPSGRWTTFDSGVALAASYFYNATATPDSGQLYFAHPNRGIIYQFGNSVSDTNAYTRFGTWISKDFNFGNYRDLKQLMSFGLDYEKHTTLTGGSFTLKPYKNLPGTQFTERAAPNNPLTYTFGVDSTKLHSESRWINTAAFGRTFRFGLNINFAGAGGNQNNDLKLNGFRFSILGIGGL